MGTATWANLPASHKMMDPRYRGITSLQIPQVVTSNRATVKIICGEYQAFKAPFRTLSPIQNTWILRYRLVCDSGIEPKRIYSDSLHSGRSWLFRFQKRKLVGEEHLVVYTDGDEISVSTEANSVRLSWYPGSLLGNRSPGWPNRNEYQEECGLLLKSTKWYLYQTSETLEDRKEIINGKIEKSGNSCTWYRESKK